MLQLRFLTYSTFCETIKAGRLKEKLQAFGPPVFTYGLQPSAYSSKNDRMFFLFFL
jgi:hypothetical protein